MGYLAIVEKWAENLQEVTLNRWLKQEGEAVAPGDSLCEIITDKVTFEYEIDVPGIVRRIYCGEKSVLPVGYAMAFIGEADEPLPEGVEERNRALVAEREQQAALDLGLELTPAALREPPGQRRVRATPAARRVARERGVTVEEVAAWLGNAEPVSEADVEAYVAAKRLARPG